MSRTSKRLALAGCLMALSAVALLLVAITLKPLPLPFLSFYLQRILDQRYHAYEVEFDEARLRWLLLEDSLHVQLQGVRAVDFDGDVIAEVPEVLVGVAFTSLLGGDLILQEVSVRDARLGFYRTSGGAVKFDVGIGKEGAAGEILQNLLIDIAVADAAVGADAVFPKVSLLAADITLGDEVSGAYLRVPAADILLAPDSQGVRSTYDLEVETSGGRLRLSAESLYKTSDQRIDLTLELNRIRPAILAEILPRMGFLAPFEVPLSGPLSLELDKFFNVSSVNFDLVGGPGSLELADYSGLNLYLRGLSASGSATDGLNSLNLTELKLNFDGAKIVMSGLLSISDQTLAVTTRLVAVDTTLAALVPRWFSQLNNVLERSADRQAGDRKITELFFEGRYDIGRGELQGEGRISYGDKDVAIDAPLATGTESQVSLAPSTQFLVNGPIDAPNFVIVPNKGQPGPP